MEVVRLIVASSGNVYEGTVPSGSTRGFFKCEKNGFTYDGEFQGDKMHGLGRMVEATGNTYTGRYANGQKNGLGEYVYASGFVYKGPYVDGQKCGPGVMYCPSGAIFSGDYAKGVREGYGELKGNNGLQYIGAFADGKQHGLGRLVLKSGDFRDRVWENDTETAAAGVIFDAMCKAEQGMLIKLSYGHVRP